MALIDDLNKVLENIDRISKDGIPLTVKHELDTPTVSYFAFMAFLVVIGAVVLAGIKDVVVHNVTQKR